MPPDAMFQRPLEHPDLAPVGALSAISTWISNSRTRQSMTSTSPTPSKPKAARLMAYIESQPGWRLVARFPDDASGASTDRPGLHPALAAAQAGLIDVLLVYRVGRFHPQPPRQGDAPR